MTVWSAGLEESRPNLHTRRSSIQSDIYQMYCYNWFSWWWAHGCPKRIENRNKRTWYRTVRQVGYLQGLFPDPWSTEHKFHLASPLSISPSELNSHRSFWVRLLQSVLYCVLNIINPLNPELNPICCLLALLGAHHFLHVTRIRVKLLNLRLLMSYIYGAPILDVSRSHTTTQHSR